MARKIEVFEALDGSLHREPTAAERVDAELAIKECARRIVDQTDIGHSDREEMIEALSRSSIAPLLAELSGAHARRGWLRHAPSDEAKAKPADALTLEEVLTLCEHRLWSHDWNDTVFKRLRTELERALKSLATKAEG